MCPREVDGGETCGEVPPTAAISPVPRFAAQNVPGGGEPRGVLIRVEYLEIDAIFPPIANVKLSGMGEKVPTDGCRRAARDKPEVT